MEENNHINLEKGRVQKGTIKVHSQIINDLSSGIYSSPASCIKELVNNSYDADAKLVTIRIKPIKDTVIVMDDGNGMNAIDFDENFAWISKSNKRNSGENSKIYDRPLIGKIGIGFIAVNEICHSMRVISSKFGEDIKFVADISFDDIIQENNTDEIIKGTYKLINEEEDIDSHYTIIELVNLKESVKDILNDRQFYSALAKEKNMDFDKIYFNNMKDILTKKHIKSFKEESAYINFIIDLSSYIPVEYIEGGPILGYEDNIINSFVKFHKDLNFSVDLDGIYLKKPIYFPLQKNQPFACMSFSEKISVTNNNGEIDTLSFEGYFFAYDKLLTPRELNGVSIKIKGIPIAIEYGYDTTFMAYPNYVDQIFRNWISGEIYINKGLEDAMNIDRKSFRVTHPHYLALQNFLHKYLRDNFFSKDVKQIYETNRKLRADKKDAENEEKKRKILKSENITISVEKQSSNIKSGITEKNPIILNQKDEASTVTISQEYKKQFKKSDWVNLEDIFIIFEKSFNESNGDISKFRELFYQYIADYNKK